MSDSVQPHRWKPTRLPCPWDSPGKNTGVGCHFLLQCMKVKSESEDAQSCLTLRDPMDRSLPGSSIVTILKVCPQNTSKRIKCKPRRFTLKHPNQVFPCTRRHTHKPGIIPKLTNSVLQPVTLIPAHRALAAPSWLNTLNWTNPATNSPGKERQRKA